MWICLPVQILANFTKFRTYISGRESHVLALKRSSPCFNHAYPSLIIDKIKIRRNKLKQGTYLKWAKIDVLLSVHFEAGK